jgi:hypothetical protein
MDAGVFPQRLAEVPRELRVDETFGWFPASLAIAALLAVLGTMIRAVQNEGFDSMQELEFVGIALVVAVLMGFWEVWRRTHPTSLFVTGGRVGIYRKGELEKVAGFGEITWYRLNMVNSLREYMLFGLCGLGGCLGALGAASSGSMYGAMWAAAAGLGGLGGLASAIWSRGMCNHYHLPKGGGTETVVLRRSDLTRVRWPSPR